MPGKVAFYNPVGPEPPPIHKRSLPHFISQISSHSSIRPSSTCAGYTTSPLLESAKTYPPDAEYVYIDEPATLFALGDVRRSDQPMLVHCDGTGEGVDFVIAQIIKIRRTLSVSASAM